MAFATGAVGGGAVAPVATQPGQSVSGAAINPGMMSVYNQLLDLNQQNYNQALGAFAQGQQTLAPQLAAVNSLYEQQRSENANLWKQAYDVAAGDIRRQATQNQGRIQQSLIGSGLGNSTVMANLSRGAERQAQQEFSRLGVGIAQQEAANRTALTQAQGNAWLQGLGLRTSLYGQQGGAMMNYRYANTAGDLTTPYASAMSGAAGGGGGGSAARGSTAYGRPGQGGGAGVTGYQGSSFLADARARADAAFYNTPGLGYSGGYAYGAGANPWAPGGITSDPGVNFNYGGHYDNWFGGSQHPTFTGDDFGGGGEFG